MWKCIFTKQQNNVFYVKWMDHWGTGFPVKIFSSFRIQNFLKKFAKLQFMRGTNNTEKLTYITLFSSAGVGCFGFKMAGYVWRDRFK